MSFKINDKSSKISEFVDRWVIIRDMIEGSRKVKLAGTTYLPFAAEGQGDNAYNVYKDEVTFYPATGRTQAGLAGIILAKAPVTNAPKPVEDILPSISYNGQSWNDIVQWSVEETIALTFGGIVVDFPAGDKPASLFEELTGGFHPIVSCYTAERIVRVERQRIRNRNMLTYVELQDPDELDVTGKTILSNRVLKLVDGFYVVEIFKDYGSGFVSVETFEPKIGSNRIPFIPFEVMTDKMGEIDPVKPLIEDVAHLNLDHYRIEGRITWIHYWQSMAVLYATGVAKAEPEPRTKVELPVDGKFNSLDNFAIPEDDGFKVGGPEAWMLSDAQSKVDYAEFSGAGVLSLERKRDKIEDRMAKTGAQILASEKVAAEAAETVAMRRQAENSTLATTARALSRKLENVLRWVAMWMGQDPKQVNFSLNTDYRIDVLKDEILNVLQADNQRGKLSDETYFYMLQKGGIYPESLTFEEEQTRRDQDSLRNPEDNGFNTNQAEDGSLDE